MSWYLFLSGLGPSFVRGISFIMAKSKHREEKKKSRAGLYTVIGVIIALLVAALLVWDSGILERSAPAVQIGEEKISATEVEFYYYEARSAMVQEADMYAQYDMEHNFDPSKPDSEQIYQGEQTYADYFLESALKSMHSVVALTQEAKKAGYTLSEEGKEVYDSQLAQIKSDTHYASVVAGYSQATYIKMRFGPNSSMGLLKKVLADRSLAEDYAKHVYDQPVYDDAALETYYADHTSDLDTFDYRLCFIPATPVVDKDEEGNDLEATEEQTAAAMAEAKKSADAMVRRVQQGQDFNTVAAEYVDEANQEAFADPEHNHYTDVLGSEIASAYKGWFDEEGRKVKDVGSFESEGTGYYVLELVSRERREDTYLNADIWSIVVNAATTETVDADGNATSAPTEEQLAAAYKTAEDLMAQWNSTTDRTEEAFNALAPKTEADTATAEAPAAEESATPEDSAPEDAQETQPEPTITPAPAPSVEMIPEAVRSAYGADFDAFVFTPGAQAGGTTIVPVFDGNTGSTIGYRVVYLNAFGPVRWKGTAENALRSKAYETWYASVEANYEPEKLDGISSVGK